jgi:hypothetical protein
MFDNPRRDTVNEAVSAGTSQHPSVFWAAVAAGRTGQVEETLARTITGLHYEHQAQLRAERASIGQLLRSAGFAKRWGRGYLTWLAGRVEAGLFAARTRRLPRLARCRDCDEPLPAVPPDTMLCGGCLPRRPWWRAITRRAGGTR